MTNELIYIDGVDVSGCLFYYDNGKCSAILGDDACKDWHNCSYKLQKQLDQLKKQNDIMLNSIKKLQNKLCSSTSQCKYFLIDVLKEVENASK